MAAKQARSRSARAHAPNRRNADPPAAEPPSCRAAEPLAAEPPSRRPAEPASRHRAAAEPPSPTAELPPSCRRASPSSRAAELPGRQAAKRAALPSHCTHTQHISCFVAQERCQKTPASDHNNEDGRCSSSSSAASSCLLPALLSFFFPLASCSFIHFTALGSRW